MIVKRTKVLKTRCRKADKKTGGAQHRSHVGHLIQFKRDERGVKKTKQRSCLDGDLLYK